MLIKYHKNFVKNYKRRISSNKNLNARFQERITLFLRDPFNPTLKNHRLSGAKKHLYSFSITGDVRVVYEIQDDAIVLLDIGTHNQIY